MPLKGANCQRVHDGHDEKREVEGGDGGRDDEERCLWAAPLVVDCGLLRVEHGQDEEGSCDAEGDDPDDGNLEGRVSLTTGVTEAQRVHQGHVTVDGDHAQVADRR